MESSESSELRTRDIGLNEYAVVTSIHDLYHYTLRSVAQLTKRSDCEQCAASSFHTSMERCLGLLYMWAQGLDLKFLQDTLDHDTGLQKIVVSGLAAMIVVVHTCLSNPTERQNRIPIRVDVASLIDSYANNEFGTDDDMNSNSSVSSDSELDSSPERSLHSHHVRQLNRLKMHVQCLMDLVPTIESCCNQKRSADMNEEPTAPAQDNAVNHIILPYVMQVQDKFASIDPILANRLGEANWMRYQRLQSLNEATIKDSDPNDDEFEHCSNVDNEDSRIDATVLQPFSEFFDSGLGASIPAISRYSPSVASHTSFLSTQSAIHRGSFRVPSTPAGVAQGLPFSCQICGLKLFHIKNRVDWKLHVFADIQPYICTFTDCPATRTTFSSRKLWAVHEMQEHRRIVVWRCFRCSLDHDTTFKLIQHLSDAHSHRVTEFSPETDVILQAARTLITRVADQVCPMCKIKGFEDERSWTSHVARHMEEVALIVLPRHTDSDEDEDKDDEDSALNHKSRSDRPAESQSPAPLKNPINNDSNGGSEPEKSLSIDKRHITDEVNDDVRGDIGDDGDEAATSIEMPLDVGSTHIVLSLEGFRTHARQLNPRLQPYLVERIAHNQLERYKRLFRNKVEHKRMLLSGQCPSGSFCVELGGKAELLTPSAGSSPNTNRQVEGGNDTSGGEAALVEGMVTPALFPVGIPLPPTTHLPARFECPFCFQVKKFDKPSDWTRHVHEDLRPFSCTFPSCRDPKPFKRKADWIRHENERHRHLERWSCKFEDCAYTCYSRDSFVQHLVREHKLQEPKLRKPGPLSSTLQERIQTLDRDRNFWQLVESCRYDTSLEPEQEPCKFCGNCTSTWKKLSVHVGKHMEQIAIPVLSLVTVRSRKEIVLEDYSDEHYNSEGLRGNDDDSMVRFLQDSTSAMSYYPEPS